MTTVRGSDSKDVLCCSFCGKSQDQVAKLIAGPKAFICDECISLCVSILNEGSKSSVVRTVNGVPTPKEN